MEISEATTRPEGVGQSSITPWKELCFQELLESFMQMARYPLMVALKNHIPAVFHVYDLYAGIGDNDYGGSSTVIFYNKLNCVGGLSGRYNLTAVEKNNQNFETLKRNIGDRDITLINGTAAETIRKIGYDIKTVYGENPEKAVGVVFLDPNGVVKEPEYRSLVQLSNECPQFGIVANMSVLQLHRNRAVKKVAGFDVYNHIGRLWNWKNDLNKKHLYVRSIERGGKFTWTIAVLTNCSLRGINSDLKECGFYNVKNEAGLRVLSQVDKKQMTIF